MRRRLHERQTVLRPAAITTNGSVIDCCVRDVSRRGAKLRLATQSAPPHDFQLLLKDTGEVHRARLRWRRGIEVGVEFLDDRRVFGRRTSVPSPNPR
jgi:PilZ domain